MCIPVFKDIHIIGNILVCFMTFTQPEWNTMFHEACQHQVSARVAVCATHNHRPPCLSRLKPGRFFACGLPYDTTDDCGLQTLVRSHVDGIFEREAFTTANGALCCYCRHLIRPTNTLKVGMLEGLYLLRSILLGLLFGCSLGPVWLGHCYVGKQCLKTAKGRAGHCRVMGAS